MSEQGVQRFGMVIGLRSECVEPYKVLHAGAGVRDLLAAANVQNFNIYLQVMPDGQPYEFAYFEYTGTDYDGDMARLHAIPRYQDWLAQCDPMQVPLPGHRSWSMMECIYFQE